MVKLLLSIKAELENVTDLVPATEGFEWFFEVQCSNCQETHPNLVSVNRADKRPLMSGKNATANFVWKCSNCKREHSATFDKADPTPYSADNNGQFAPLVMIECRGLEFTDFDPQGTWKCVGADSGVPFTDVSLDEGEWVDYDEKARLPVGVSQVKSKWSRADRE